MPIFGFGEERFHPHLALAQRFLIGRSLLIAADHLQILLANVPVDAAPLLARRALRLDRTGIADRRWGLIEQPPVSGWTFPDPLQDGPLWAAILIDLRLVAKVRGRPHLVLLFPIGQGQ